MTVALACQLLALACLVAAALFDCWRFEIPDTLSVVIIAAAIGYGVVTPGFGWISHAAAGLLFFAVGLWLFNRGWMGGGDIKVMTATACWAGLDGLVMQMAAIAIAGGALAAGLLLLRRGLFRAGVDTGALPRLFRPDAPLPYAVAILGGALWWALRVAPLGAA